MVVVAINALISINSQALFIKSLLLRKATAAAAMVNNSENIQMKFVTSILFCGKIKRSKK